MNVNVKEKWVKALRSNEYTQGKNYLNCCGKYCCLGVLTDLYLKETTQEWEEPNARIKAFDGRTCVLPKIVQQWAGLYSDLGDEIIVNGEPASLVGCNDSLGLNFNEIADLIESQL
jgi:hypothetical protein